MATRLALFLLGPPSIERDGLPVKLDRRKAIALLAYLAVTGKPQRRETLVNLLWPEYDTSRGRAALRRTLYTLRKALDSVCLQVDRQEIGLGFGAGLWVDVAQFHDHLSACKAQVHPAKEACQACVAALIEAVALVRGDFMSGFGLKDSVNFDDWLLLQTETLQRELSGALESLIRWHTDQGDYEAALGYSRQRLQIDPLDEPAHRHLMRLYDWSGQRSAALRQYEACAGVLADQLDVPPQEATTALFQAIQAGRAEPPPRAPRTPRAGQMAGQPATTAPQALSDSPIEAPGFLVADQDSEVPTFVAREHELAALDQSLELALAGEGRVAFITGEAGQGKTALLQEFSRRAQAEHTELIVASGNCNAYTGIGDPYLPFREVLELLTGDVEARWAAGTFGTGHARRLWRTLPLTLQALLQFGPDLIGTFISAGPLLKRAVDCANSQDGEEAAGLDHLTGLVERGAPAGQAAPSVQQSYLFEQYTRVLSEVARTVPLALIVDDLQWADLGSINLLFHLGRQVTGSRILIVGAYRPEEVALGRVDPGAGGGEYGRHPLEPVAHELQRLYGDIVVSLSSDGSQQFVEALLDSELNRLGPSFREMLYRQTRGQPLFTLELLRGLQARGDLVRDAQGFWQEGAAVDWELLPSRVEAVIAERIGRLPEPLRDILEVASVEGEVFTAEMVARVRKESEGEIVRLLSGELDRVHRLVVAQGVRRVDGKRLSRYRFRHILYQRYLYTSLDPVERAYLHESVGNTLEAMYEGQDRALVAISGQLAWQFQKAGLPARAAHYLCQAGERALQLSAYEEAIAHLTRGLDLLLTQPDSRQRAEQELTLQFSLGMALVGPKGYSSEVQEAYDRTRELSQQLGKTMQLARVLGELSVYHYVRAEPRMARELAAEALGLAMQEGDPLLVAVDRSYLGFISFCLGEYAAALDLLMQVIALYDPAQHHRSFVSLRGSDVGLTALAYSACCLWSLGYPDQAQRRSEEALALARDSDHPFSLADVLCYGGCMFDAMSRDLRALGDHAHALKRLAGEKLFRGWLGSATCFAGEALAATGHLEEGIAKIREGLEIEEFGERCCRTGYICSLASALGEAGRPDEGLIVIAEALETVKQTDERFAEAELHRVKAELLLIQGDDAGAEASLLQSLEVARRQHARSWELRTATSLARLWQNQGRSGQARELLVGVYDWFTEGFDTRDLKAAEALLADLSPRD